VQRSGRVGGDKGGTHRKRIDLYRKRVTVRIEGIFFG